MRTRPRPVLAAAVTGAALTGALALAAPSSAAPAQKPAATLVARAALPATAYQPGPVSGTLIAPVLTNGVTPPFPGQPVPGFSAVIHAPGDEDGKHLLGMPDNGYGAKGNSADFLLRIYDVTPRYRLGGGRGGDGGMTVNAIIQLSDPDHLVPFPIVNENTPDRLLTGADFDIESLQRDARGTLWIGEEFGPYLLNVDPTGKLLRAPIPLPDGGKSPQSPDLKPGEAATVPASRGFESMAVSEDGWTLYPILEGARIDDPNQSRRIVYQFDVRKAAYTAKTWSFTVASPELVLGDAQVISGRRLVLIERDNFGGPLAVVKRLVVTDLGRVGADGFLLRRDAVDLLDIADPRGVSSPARPNEFGVGPVFRFPFVSVESVLPLEDGKVLVADDNNFPFNDGRIPGQADDTETVILDVPGLDRRP